MSSASAAAETGTNAAMFSRLTSLLPVQDKELYALYEKAVRTFWTHDEVDLSADVVQWKEQLTDDERYFLSHVLGFFVQSDQLVNINLSERFVADIEDIPDWYRKYARLFYNAQMMIEDIHTLSYETMVNELITDPAQNEHFKKSIANIPCVAKKAEWAARYINDQESEFPVRLIAFAILEGLFFSGSFCSIFWIEQKNLLRGLTHYNKLIQRDENLHYEFALTLYLKLRDDPSVPFDVDPGLVVEMVTNAVAIETEFINHSIPCSMIGMNVDLMTQYIKFVADQLLKDIQLPKLYNVTNPFDFMVALGVVDRENFFEVRPSVYSKPILADTQYDSNDEDF